MASFVSIVVVDLMEPTVFAGAYLLLRWRLGWWRLLVSLLMLSGKVDSLGSFSKRSIIHPKLLITPLILFVVGISFLLLPFGGVASSSSRIVHTLWDQNSGMCSAGGW